MRAATTATLRPTLASNNAVVSPVRPPSMTRSSAERPVLVVEVGEAVGRGSPQPQVMQSPRSAEHEAVAGQGLPDRVDA